MEAIRVSQSSRLRTLDGWYRTEKPIVFPTFDFPSLDKLLGGGFSTGVYVLTAPPGMGKTALAKQIQDSWSRHGLWSVYASWELDAMELQARSIARISGYSFRDLYHRRVGMAEWKKALETYEEEARYTELLTPDDVDPKAGLRQQLTIPIIESVLRAHVAENHSVALIVDYLHLIPNQAETEEQQAKMAIEELKRLARRYQSPVLCLAASNRLSFVDPQVGSVRGTSAVEYESDMLLVLHVPGARSLEDVAKAMQKTPIPLALTVKKGRHDPQGTVSLEFHGAQGRFVDIEGAIPTEHKRNSRVVAPKPYREYIERRGDVRS